MSDHKSFLDSSETRTDDEREAQLLQRLKEQVDHAQKNSEYFNFFIFQRFR